jgi:biofilm protein TabA
VIVDTLANSNRYRGIALLLDRGLEAMGRLTQSPLADGWHEIAGPSLTASFSSYETKDPDENRFEAHRRSIDIQVVLGGSETLYWAPLASLQLKGEYSEAKDVAFYEGSAGLAVPLEPGWFTVLFPHDAHKPGCLRGGPSQVRKLVIKVVV